MGEECTDVSSGVALLAGSESAGARVQAVQEWRAEASMCPSLPAASRKKKYSIWMLERAAADQVKVELMIGRSGRR